MALSLLGLSAAELWPRDVEASALRINRIGLKSTSSLESALPRALQDQLNEIRQQMEIGIRQQMEIGMMTIPRYTLGNDTAESGVAIAARQREESATATAVLDRPTGEPWTLPPVMPDHEYLRVAAKIGLTSPALIKAKLERFLVMRGWPVYDSVKVWAYLKSLAQAETLRVYGPPTVHRSFMDDWQPSRTIEPCWKPLRDRDLKQISGGVYPHAVPLHALLKVEELEAEFDKGVLAFGVSDYEAKAPDPFLLVTAMGLPNYVIDVWDEPGFGA